MDKKMAFEHGRDCGLNGSNTINSHFGIFSQPEFTKAWEAGKASVVKKDLKPCIFCGGELERIREALFMCKECKQEYIACVDDMEK